MKVGDRIYVPATLLPDARQSPFALEHRKIIEVQGKRISVETRNGDPSPLLPKSRMLHACGIAIMRIGDFQTEQTLLDPLAKSLLQFARMLLDDDSVRLFEARSLPELKAWWTSNGAAYTHILLVAHGAPDGVHFAVDGKRTPLELSDAFGGGGKRKTLLSLACETGRKAFAQGISQSAHFERVIAPFHSVHGAIASQFVQTYLASHLLQGHTPKIAWRDARRATPGTDSFRMWVNGKMERRPAG